MGSKRLNRRKSKGTESLLTGLALAAGFGIAWALTGWWWFVFPTVFAGIMPAISGLQTLITARSEERIAPQTKAAKSEKEILRVAKEEGGRITPAMVALKTSLTTQEAETILQEMAKRNYAAMHVTNEGRVEYEFPEFGRGVGHIGD
jgi:hypothetical protein